MAGPRDTVAVQTQSPGPVQPGAGWQLFWAPSVSRKVGSPSAGLGDQGTRAACSSQPYGLGSSPAAPGTPPGTGPLPLRALRALRLPAWLSPFPDAGAGCLICVTSSGPCAPSVLWASSWGSERLRSLCRASWDDPRPHSTPNPRPLRPRGALLASRVACPNPPLGCTRKCPLGASRMGPHLDSSPGHSDCLAGARPGHQPDPGPALRRPQSRPRRLRRGDPPSAASQGRGLDPRNRSVPQASLVVGAFLF